MENGEQPFFGTFNLGSDLGDISKVETNKEIVESIEQGVSLEDIKDDLQTSDIDATNNLEDTKDKDDVTVPATDKQDAPLQSKDTPSYVRALAKEFLEGYQIEISNPGGEDKVLDLEKDSLDLETVIQLIKDRQENEIQEIKSNSISTKNLENSQKEIIDLIARNGNPSELIKLHKEYIEPLSQMDITSEDGQEQVLVEYYTQKGTDPSDIDITIEALKLKGLLEDRAIKAKDILENAFNKQVEFAKERAEEEIKNIEKAHKEFSKNLVETFKNKQGITKDVQISKLKKFATEYVEDAGGNKSRLTAMDAEYTKQRNNPEQAAELALFFYDREEYLKVITKKETDRDKLDVAKKITLTRLSKSSNSNKTNFEKLVDDELTFNIG